VQDNKDEELIFGKYDGIGRVVDTRHFDTYGIVGYGDFDADEPHGYNTGQCIDVLVTEGVVFRKRWHHKGETVEHICSRGRDIYIIGKPQVGDMVGFRSESYYAQIWEKIEIPPGYTPSKRKRSRKVSPPKKPSVTLPANKKVSREAVKLETTNPSEALKLYSQLESENAEFYKGIFTAGMIGFILGFIVIFYGAEYMGIEKESLLLPLIWYSIGFLILLSIWAPKASRRFRGANIFWIPLVAVFYAGAKMIEAIFFFISMLIIALVSTLAIYSIIRVIHYFIFGGPFVFNSLFEVDAVRWPISILFIALFIASFLFLGLFDVSIPKRPTIPLIFRVIRLKKREALSTMALFVVLILLALGWYSDNVFYYNLPVGLGLSIITGGLIALALSSGEKDHLLANLYRLAKARCLIRMDHDFEAYFPLRYTHEDRKVEKPGAKRSTVEPLLKRLFYATVIITDNRNVRNRKTLFKWSDWGTYVGSHEFRDGRHFKNEISPLEYFHEFTDSARTLMEKDEYSEYREFIKASIENTEKLEAIGNFPPKKGAKKWI